MSEIHVGVETVLLVVGGSTCTALLLAKVVLLAYDDLRGTWRRLKGRRNETPPLAHARANARTDSANANPV